MKYIVTAPPGALGHFLARIISNEYDFSVNPTGSYHGLTKNYSSQTKDMDTYAGAQDNDLTVICLHNFDNQDLTKKFQDRLVVNIVVNGYWEIYLNNFYRKAIQPDKTGEKKFVDRAKEKFPTSNNSLREEFFYIYQHAIQGNVAHLPTNMIGLNVNFSDFYQLDTFIKLITSISGIDVKNPELIWKHFIEAQKSIIDRVNHYQKICDAVIHNPTPAPTIPEYFDNVDFGIMCGMIQHQYGVDLLNLDNDLWM
jgi:hypothetical protein